MAGPYLPPPRTASRVRRHHHQSVARLSGPVLQLVPAYCPFVLLWTPVLDTAAGNTYVIPANSTLVNGARTTHAQVTGATLAALVTNLNLNAYLGTLGTWAVDPTGVLLQLTEATGATNTVDIFFQAN